MAPEDGVYFIEVSSVGSNVGTYNLNASLSTFVLGDVNRDSTVNFFDIQPFIDVLAAEGFQDEADANRDGVVNFFDIDAFIGLLTNAAAATGSSGAELADQKKDNDGFVLDWRESTALQLLRKKTDALGQDEKANAPVIRKSSLQYSLSKPVVATRSAQLFDSRPELLEGLLDF